MSDFNHRESELIASFEADKANFKIGEQVDGLVRLRGLLPARAGALAALLGTLTGSSSDAGSHDFEEKFQAFIDSWVLPFSHLTDGLLYPGNEINWWREREVAREYAFMQGLIGLGAAQARDELSALEAGLAKLISDLEKKWATMSEEAKRIEALEAEACKRMSDILSQGVRDGTDAWARYGETLQRLLEVFQKIPDITNEAVVYLAKEAGLPSVIAEAIPRISLAGKDYFAYGQSQGLPASELAKANPELFRDPGMAVSETIQKAIGPNFELLVTAINGLYKSVLPVAAGRYAEQVGYLRGLLPNQGAILVSLSDTRRDVDEFLRANGLDKARSVYDRIESALHSWASAQSTSALQSDAGAWADAALESFKKRYERMADAFGVFVQANQGRFIGSVSRSVENVLIFTDVWADRSQGLLDIGMDERLREWRKGTIEVSNTLASASSQVFDKIRYLPPDIQNSITGALNSYWSRLVDQVNREAAQATSALNSAEELVNDSSLKRDLDRSSLRV